MSDPKKRKGYDETEVVEINARVGTRREHFLEFLSSIMNTLGKHGMKGRYLVMDNAVIHKVDKVQNLIQNRGYKATYLTIFKSY